METDTVIFQSAAKEGRPVRLSPDVRKFAKDSLDGIYGKELKKGVGCISMDDVPGFSDMAPYDQYDAMISAIAEKAPLRLVPGEKLVGSATLSGAIDHVVPAFYQGEVVFESVSHLTCNFDKLLRVGLNQYMAELSNRAATMYAEEPENKDGYRFLESMACVYKNIGVWHGRYMKELARLQNEADSQGKSEYYSELIYYLKDVPFKKPTSFRSALQSLWFSFAFIRLCGNWPGIGRMDVMLEEYLQADLRAGVLTLDEARELLANFFVKGCEWISLDITPGGDAQHYQNIVLGGIDENGKQVEGDMTRLILEVVEELPIGDFPIAVRISRRTPRWLVKKAAEVIRHGGGVVAVYNEDLVIQSMVDFGYELSEARQFANDGCWEVQVPGKTNFTYLPWDALLFLQKDVLHLDQPDAAVLAERYHSVEDILQAYLQVLRESVDGFNSWADSYHSHRECPASVVAFFEDGCVERAKDYFAGGPVYSSFSLHYGGLQDVANSLYAIQKLVYDDKKITLPEFVRVLQKNWEGAEDLRLYARNHYEYFGNDNPVVDQILSRIIKCYTERMWKTRTRNGIWRSAGISTFGRQISDAQNRYACPHGFKRGDILAGNLSPTPGTELHGPTAIIKSHCASDLSKLTCGTALDLQLDPSVIKDKETAVNMICGLINSFVELGGFFMQIDVLSIPILRDAQRHPEKYHSLSVRVSGWSARFVTLDSSYQQMVIERAEHH